MGINVDRAGSFRALLVEKGISKTREKGYPQLVGKVKLIELYDEEQKEWFPIEDWDMETNFFSCLYGVKKGATDPTPTLGHEQAMKVFGWDGASLAELDKTSHEGLKFQVRTQENTYEGARQPFQVSWIDVYDADPVYTLKKLDAKEVKDLDAQFSSITASAKTAVSAKGPKTPTKAKAPKHPARVSADDGKKPTAPKAPAKNPADMSPTEKKAILKAKSDRIKAAAAAVNQATPEAPAETKAAPPVPGEENAALPLPEAEGSLTKAEAWGKIFEMRDPTIDDATVKELWDAAIEEIAGEGAKHADLTGEQWYQVKEIVLKDCGKF